jgi:hypothetical protein
MSRSPGRYPLEGARCAATPPRARVGTPLGGSVGHRSAQHGSMGTLEASGKDSPPDPNDSRKPERLTDLEGRTWKYVARKSWREFLDGQCPDLAAALTYYGVLSIFPAARADSPARPRRPGRDVRAEGRRRARPSRLRGEAGHGPARARTARELGVRGTDLGPRPGGRSLDGIRVRRCVLARDEPHLRDPRRPAVLEAAPHHDAHHARGRRAGRLCAADVGRLRSAGRLDRRRRWPGQPGPHAVADPQVARDRAVGRRDRRAALLRHAQRTAAKFRWLSVGAAVAIVIAVVASVFFSIYVAQFGSYNKVYGWPVSS